MDIIKETQSSHIIKTLMAIEAQNIPISSKIFAEQDLKDLCEAVRTVFLSEPMLLQVQAPINLAGDIHGQYYDLLSILTKGGALPDSKYLFLGDYVDRGANSLETILLLFALKLEYPHSIYLLRGNHECESISRIYGFYDECKRKYSIQLWQNFIRVFDCLPIAAVINSSILCMHGGLSPQMSKLDQIDIIQRPIKVVDESIVCDILWNSPAESTFEGWRESSRGNRKEFGPNIVQQFLKANGLSSICRSHQYMEKGYEFQDESQQLVSIFSAHNYHGKCSNTGIFMKIDDQLARTFHKVCSDN